MDLIFKNMLNGTTVRCIDIGKAEKAATNTLFFGDFVEKRWRPHRFRGRFHKQERFRDPLSNDKGSID
jgi:hypothetical protein